MGGARKPELVYDQYMEQNLQFPRAEKFCTFPDGTQVPLDYVGEPDEAGNVLVSYLDDGLKQVLWIPSGFISGAAEAGN